MCVCPVWNVLDNVKGVNALRLFERVKPSTALHGSGWPQGTNDTDPDFVLFRSAYSAADIIPELLSSLLRAVYISVDSASYRAHSYHRAYKHSGLEVLMRDALLGTFNTMHRFW